jgi:hypothetical protein
VRVIVVGGRGQGARHEAGRVEYQHVKTTVMALGRVEEGEKLCGVSRVRTLRGGVSTLALDGGDHVLGLGCMGAVVDDDSRAVSGQAQRGGSTDPS